MWDALGQMYGAKLEREFSAGMPAAWRQDVDSLSDSQIVRGLRVLREQGKTWPPSLGEFNHACKHITESEAQRQRIEAAEQQRALPKPVGIDDSGRDGIYFASMNLASEVGCANDVKGGDVLLVTGTCMSLLENEAKQQGKPWPVTGEFNPHDTHTKRILWLHKQREALA